MLPFFGRVSEGPPPYREHTCLHNEWDAVQWATCHACAPLQVPLARDAKTDSRRREFQHSEEPEAGPVVQLNPSEVLLGQLK